MSLDAKLMSQVQRYAEKIRSMARTVATDPNLDTDLRRMAAHRASRPIDYMRYAEFGAVLPLLQLKPGSHVLDAGGPQWLTFALAAEHPEVRFHYINLADYELHPFEKVRSRLRLDNIVISKEDLRQLSFSDNGYDEIVSISVLEHVYPEEGGDDTALGEMKRVLKTGGSLVITIPCKEKANVVYVQGDVYERARTATAKQFFAREYSPQTLKSLVSRIGFGNTRFSYISEVPSMASIDYLEWGPLRGTQSASILLRLFRGIERVCKIPVEKTLASRKLSVTTEEVPRLVNAVVWMQKSASAECVATAMTHQP